MSTNRTLLADYIQGVNAPRNYIKNPGAEKNTVGVTDASGIVTRSTTDPLEGAASFVIDATATGQLAVFQANNFQAGLLGQSCEWQATVLGDASLITMYATLAGSAVSAVVTGINSGTNSQTYSAIFPCGASTSDAPAFVVESTGDAASIKIDGIYLGKALSLVSGMVISPWITYTPVFTGFGTVTVQNARYRQVGDVAEIEATFTSGTSTGVVAQVSLPTGLSVASGLPTLSTSGSWFRGVVTTANGGSTIKASGDTSIFFGPQVFGSGSYDALTKAEASSFIFSGQIMSFKAGVPIAEWIGSVPIVRGDTTDLGGVAFTEATTSCIWTTTSATMAAFAVDSDCPVPTVSGNTTAPATKIPAFIAPSLRAGRYKVEAFGRLGGDQSSSGSQQCNWEIYDGTTSGGKQTTLTQVNTGASEIPVAGVFTYSSNQTNKQFEVRAQRVSGNGNCLIDARFADLTFVLTPLTQAVPAPFIPSSVFSGFTGIEKVYSGELNCDASSTFNRGGSGLTAGNRLTTSCGITIESGGFSAQPWSCSPTIKSATVQAMGCVCSSATSCTVYGPNADYDASITIRGPK